MAHETGMGSWSADDPGREMCRRCGGTGREPTATDDGLGVLGLVLVSACCWVCGYVVAVALSL